MKTATRIAIIAFLASVAILAAGCTTSTSGVAPTPDERPVPGGTPVMYEFYTDT